MANGLVDWKIKIEADISDIQKKINSIESQKIKFDLDIDTDSLNKAMRDLNAMMSKLGDTSKDVADFSKLAKQITEVTSNVKNLGAAVGKIDQKNGVNSLLQSINQIDSSLKHLMNDVLTVKTKTDNGIIEVSAVSKTLDVLDRLENALSSIKKSFDTVGEGKAFDKLLTQIQEVQKAASNIKLNLSLDVGDINNSKSQQNISKAVNRERQAYQKLFDQVKRKDANLYKYSMPEGISDSEASGIMKNLIEDSEKRRKIKYKDIFPEFYKEIKNALSSRRYYEKAATVDDNVLGNIFGKSEVDLSGISGQLSDIASKLGSIVTSAQSFSAALSNGLNLTAQLDQVQKLQDEIKDLKSQIQSLQSANVSIPTSVSNNQPATQNKYQQKSTSKQVNTNGVNGSIVTNMDDVEKKIREETEYLIKNTQGVIKELTSFYNTKDELVKTQMKVLDQAGNMTTYTTSFSKRLKKDGSVDYDVWQSHIDQEKDTADLRERKTAYDQLISTIGEYSVLLKKVANGNGDAGDVDRLKQLRENIATLQKNPILSNAQIETSQKKLTELYNAVKKIKDELANKQQSQSQSLVNKAVEDQLSAYEKMKKLKLDISKLDDSNPKKVAKQQDLQDAEKEFVTATNILKVHQQDYDVEKQRAELKRIQVKYQEQEQAYSKSQSQSLVNKAVEDQLSAYERMWQIKTKIASLDKNKDFGNIEKLKQEYNYYKNIHDGCEKILEVNRQNYNVQSQIAAKAEIESNYKKQSFANTKTTAVKNADSVINSYSSKANSYASSKPTVKSESFQNNITELNNYIIKLKQIKQAMTKVGDTPQLKKLEREFKIVEKQAGKTVAEIKQMSTSNKGSTELSRLKELSKLTAAMQKYSGVNQEAKDKLQSYVDMLRHGNIDTNVEKIASAWRKVLDEEIAVGRGGESFTSKIKNSGISKLASDLANMVSLWDIINVIRQASEAVIELNTDIVDLAKVSELTTEQIYADFNSYAKIAEDIGGTISDTITATTAWAKNGYSIEDSKQLAEVSILYKNVGDDMTIDEVNEYLTSTLQGYQMAADEAEHIVDVFNEVSNNESITSGGLGAALQRSASSFNAANTDLEESIALITATNSVVQDPEKVGNMWKTKFLSLS